MFENKYIVVTYSTQTVESCKIHVCNFGRKGGVPEPSDKLMQPRH